MMRALLFATLLLSSCSQYYEHEDGHWVKRPVQTSCMFGGNTPEQDAICAERNFGKDGNAIIAERRFKCPKCGTADAVEVGADMQFCALNCARYPGE